MTRFFASFALATVAFALAPQALKAANPLCPLLNATKHGTYVVYGTGTIVGSAQRSRLAKSLTTDTEILWQPSR